MAKRKVLPENFRKIVEKGDLQKFANVFEECEIDARLERGKSTANAFSISGLNVKQARFLIENGFNLNSDCGFGYPAIAFQADNRAILKLLLEYRANINCVVDVSKGSALFYAANTNNIKAVKNLLEFGASVTARNSSFSKSYLLDEILSTCTTEQLIDRVAISKMLLEAGAKPSKETTEYVKAILETFEEEKENIKKDEVKKYIKAEKELSELFGVEIPDLNAAKLPPIELPKIEVTSTNWWEQYNELWAILVPERGPSNTIQGEIIRIVGKISYELLDNGGANWDREFVKMARALEKYLTIEDDKDAETANAAIALANKISKRSSETDIIKLSELAVKWVLANPNAIYLEKVDYKR